MTYDDDFAVKLSTVFRRAAKAEPVARVGKPGSLGDMVIVEWLGEQPPDGTLLYAVSQPAVPDDWVMVPREPTEAMMSWTKSRIKREELPAIYKLMVAHAPNPPGEL